MVTTPDALHADVDALIVANRASVFRARLFGGPRALSENVANRVKQILQ